MRRLRTMFAVLFVAFAAGAAAQSSPAPAFSTIPMRPAVNESFEGVLSAYGYQAALGVVGMTTDISNRNITIGFDFGCGIICPGIPSYSDFHFPMPALPAGDYQVHFDFSGGATADFPLQIGGNTAPLSVPTVHAPSLALIALLLLALGSIDLSSRRTRHEGSHRTCA